MLDVRRLQLLCDLSRLGTIAAVARARTYTPSAVSQQLAVLEREAGVTLLERTGRRVAFTGAGRILVQHAETVLAALEHTTAALAAVTAGLSGPLRIGAFPTAVRTLLPAALVALGREHPGLELMVTECDPVAVPAALRERRLDVGLLHDYDIVPAEPDPALGTAPLLDDTVYLAVADAGPAPGPAVPGPAIPGALHDHRDAAWIMASPGTLCHTVTLQACRTAGFTPRARHHADDFATVLALVAAGQGVSLVPSWRPRSRPPESVSSRCPPAGGPASPAGRAPPPTRPSPRSPRRSAPPPAPSPASNQAGGAAGGHRSIWYRMKPRFSATWS